MLRSWFRKLLKPHAESNRSTSRPGRPKPSRFRRLGLELLEDRTLPATLEIAPGGLLSYTAAAGVVNILQVSLTAGNYTFMDAGETITLGPNAVLAGWMGSGTNTVTGPNASVNSIAIDLGDQLDILTLG